MSSVVIAMLVSAAGALVTWRGALSSPGESERRDAGPADFAAVTAAVCLVVALTVGFAWIPAAAACGEADGDCAGFTMSSATTFVLMLLPITAVVAGLWRVGVFDLAPRGSAAPTRDAPNDRRGSDRRTEAASTEAASTEATSVAADAEAGVVAPERAATASPPDAGDEGADAESSGASEASPEDATPALAPLANGEPATHDAALDALEALLRRSPVAVVLSHAEPPEVNELGLEIAQAVDASVYMVGRADATMSPDFERDHEGELSAGHEDELSLAVAGRALEAVLFLDALGEFSSFTLQMLEQTHAGCITAQVTDVSRGCRVVLPCAIAEDASAGRPTRQALLEQLAARLLDDPEPQAEPETETESEPAREAETESEVGAENERDSEGDAF